MDTETRLKKELKALSDAVLLHLHYIDTKLGNDKSAPAEAGQLLAKLCNHLDMANDSVRRFSLDEGITALEKEKAVKKLLEKQK